MISSDYAPWDPLDNEDAFYDLSDYLIHLDGMASAAVDYAETVAPLTMDVMTADDWRASAAIRAERVERFHQLGVMGAARLQRKYGPQP